MSLTEGIMTATLGVLLVVNIIYYTKCKHKIRKFLVGSVLSMAMLYPIIKLLGNFGINIAFNYVTCITTAILGIPGIILLIVLHIV